MHRLLGALAALAFIACSGESPSSPEQYRSLSSLLGTGAQASNAAHVVMNTQMRNELESPACPSEAKGHAHLKVNDDGTIDSDVTLNNKGESVRFGHIHHLNAGQPTGPIIWWLSSPVGTDLNLVGKHLTFHQQGIFVSNTHFATEAAAHAALLVDPASFYVNFHSDNCPGGFARGFLP